MPPRQLETDRRRDGEATRPERRRRDSRLHELLALLDGFRCGTVREPKLAREELAKHLVDAPAD